MWRGHSGHRSLDRTQTGRTVFQTGPFGKRSVYLRGSSPQVVLGRAGAASISAFAWMRHAILRFRYARCRVRQACPCSSWYRCTSSAVLIFSKAASSRRVESGIAPPQCMDGSRDRGALTRGPCFDTEARIAGQFKSLGARISAVRGILAPGAMCAHEAASENARDLRVPLRGRHALGLPGPYHARAPVLRRVIAASLVPYAA